MQAHVRWARHKCAPTGEDLFLGERGLAAKGAVPQLVSASEHAANGGEGGSGNLDLTSSGQSRDRIRRALAVLASKV